MFSEKLKLLREKNNISQYELAEKIYVSRTAVSKWERGKGMPSKSNLNAICEFFDIDESVLLSKDELINEVNKLNQSKDRIICYLPVFLTTNIVLILTLLEMFVFIRKGIYLADNRYYPNLSILTVLKGWSLVPIFIYICFMFLNLIITLNLIKLSDKIRKLIAFFSCIFMFLVYIGSFIVSFSLIKPKNYGMFWEPHGIER